MPPGPPAEEAIVVVEQTRQLVGAQRLDALPQRELLPGPVLTPRRTINPAGVGRAQARHSQPLRLLGARVELADALGVDLVVDQVSDDLAHLARDKAGDARQEPPVDTTRQRVTREVDGDQNALDGRRSREWSLGQLARNTKPLRRHLRVPYGTVAADREPEALVALSEDRRHAGERLKDAGSKPLGSGASEASLPRPSTNASSAAGPRSDSSVSTSSVGA
jgi:hypothetical protein